MVRFWNRVPLSKFLQNGFNRTEVGGVQPKRIHCPKIVSRYLSNESLLCTMGNYENRFPSLSHPLPGIKLSPCLPDFVEQNPTMITTLPNGLKIASEDAPGPAASVGIYVDSGSVYETGDYIGVTHLLERLAFKSTKNRSCKHIVRDIEATGGNAGASGSREQMAYIYDTLKAYIPEAVELLVDCLRNPLFLDFEVEEQVANAKKEIHEITGKDPQQFLLESLHVTGYSGSLGNPMMPSETALQRLDGSVIGKFYFENYTADRIVLAAFGVEHEHLLAIAEPLLYDLKGGLPVSLPKSSYNGGEARFRHDFERTHVAIAFEVPGGWHDDKNATALTVLQTLMGGGGSFSAGGPGKGMHSRLYLRVLNKYQQVHSFSAFSSMFNDTGLFGIFSTTGSDFVAKAVDVAVAELQSIATPGQVTQVELDRAKNATRSAILMNLESRSIVAEDIGRQILTYGSRKPVEHFLRCLDELTLDDLSNLAQKMVSSPLTMACLGDVDCVPSYETVKLRFQTAI
ncbi:mitochondrial-processing peptidase subunit alpha-like [Phalaenopsis equestris]|uniref:mitochondrial-processing peptidase subunit alpha-like n=1 Tax=Phalaenopsis equestris TaxID=78828 RepID=UPI0009E2BC71|nr:mitochondrial-processing peptidase subunit alpha-like [Phalaenopsis equestris]XP_020573356.1 mitochondrial-processing peptidase subunit alpha-like [Phalaenopsis equestris]